MKKYVLMAVISALMIASAGCKAEKSSSGSTEVPEQEINSAVETRQQEEEIDPAVEARLREEIDKGLEVYDEDEMQEGYLDYSMRLFAESATEGKNSMISPVSVMMALDMAAAGAKGETQSQITDLFCEGAGQGQVENFCRDLLERYESSQDVELHLANSIWVKDTVADKIDEEYLVRADYIFDAEAVLAPFDQTTVDAVNQWCVDNTDGMIDHLIDDISPDAKLILMNATALDAPWQDPYEDSQVSHEDFTAADGRVREVKMLNSMEHNYFETQDAIGFMKYYEGWDYAFLAILPDEDMTADEYVQGLTGEKYMDFWNSRTGEYDVDTKMPEFTYEYELEMNEVLMDMGMTQAFSDGAADFSGILEDDGLYIGIVLHKTFIEVGQDSTRAAAVTETEIRATAAMGEEEIEVEVKEVHLDRPFVYAIVEADTGMPLFIGTLQSVQ